jgi:hypothetical protein
VEIYETFFRLLTLLCWHYCIRNLFAILNEINFTIKKFRITVFTPSSFNQTTPLS